MTRKEVLAMIKRRRHAMTEGRGQGRENHGGLAMTTQTDNVSPII
jgi:hypothetical protein